MRGSQVYYPYPVLQNDTDDYVKSKFNVSIRPQINQSNYYFSVHAETSNEELMNLIVQEKAFFSIRIICNNTRFRDIINSTKNDFTFSVPSSSIDGKVIIQSLIIAATDIEDFTNEYFSEDYQGINFKIFRGDTLAIGEEFEYDTEKEVDPLVKVPSIFSVLRNDKKGAPSITIDSSGDKVVILLSNNNFNKYGELKSIINNYSSLAPLISSLFFVPALSLLLEEIKWELEYAEDRNSLIEEKEANQRWFRILKSKLEEIDIDLNNKNAFTDSTLLICQKVLGEPLEHGLKYFDELHSTSIGSD